MENKIYYLIGKHSKSWVCDQLEISRPLLDKRIKKDNWKKSEWSLIESLYKSELIKE